MLTTVEIETPRGTLRGLDSRGRGPAVLLFHGNSGAAELFAPLIGGSLGRDYRCVALSFLGHGSSDRSRHVDADYCVAGLADSIASCIARLGLPRPTLVGHSLGGHALATALPRLDRVAGLMLISAPPINLATLGNAMRPDPTAGVLFQGPLSGAEEQRLRDVLLSSGHRLSESTRATLLETIRKTDVRFRPALLASIVAGRVADERGHLEASTVPTCVVIGRQDPFLQPAYVDTVALRAPFRGGVHLFEKSGHFPHLDAPEEFGALLAELLRTSGEPLAAAASS